MSSAATPSPLTSDALARKRWEKENWPEPRDKAQHRLYVLYWTGVEPGVVNPYRNWGRPAEWIADLVRA